MTPSSLPVTWALYPNSTGLVPELDRLADAALADRPRIGVVQADQPGRAVGHLPGQPGPGLGHHRGGPADHDRQLAQRPSEPAAAVVYPFAAIERTCAWSAYPIRAQFR
jgi:hypothetical protein